MRSRLSPRLLPEAVAEAIFAKAPLSPCERNALAQSATRDPQVLQAMVDTLLLHVHEPTELDVIVGELAAHPRVRQAFDRARAEHQHARARRANPLPERLSAADPRLPCSPLGELESVTIRPCPSRATVHTFAPPRPLLASNPSGLVILGGAYRIGPRGLGG